MRLIRSRVTDEEGYLLLESLVTLSMILGILLILYPLVVDWLVLREVQKDNVEHTRMLYEVSMQWPEKLPSQSNQSYVIQMTDSNLAISKNNKTIGVDIYEVEFD